MTPEKLMRPGQSVRDARFTRTMPGLPEAKDRRNRASTTLATRPTFSPKSFGVETGQVRDSAVRDSARREDFRYTLNVAFLDAVRGAKTRITLPGGDTLDVQIPAGVADGQTLRLRGKGGPGYGSGLPGDALVTVILEPHPVFRREGLDIHVTLPITIDEAILGGKVMVPTIAGPVSVTIPKAVSSGRVLRLRGRGISRGSAPPGDQLVELRITSPAKIDPDLQSFMEKWRTSHAYDPRKDVFGNLTEGGRNDGQEIHGK